MKLSSVSGLLAILINDQIGASVLKANTFFSFLQVHASQRFWRNMKEQSRTLDSHLKTLQVILTWSRQMNKVHELRLAEPWKQVKYI